MLNMIKKAAHLANKISQNNPQTSDFATAQQIVLDTCIKLADKGYLAGSQVPFYVKLIANKRKLSDQKRTADSYQNGEMPSGFTAY